MTLHPACQRFLDEDPTVAAWRDVGAMTLERARTMGVREAVEEPAPVQAVHAVHDVEIPGSLGPIGARVYRPYAEAPVGVVVWLHGGGMVLGSMELADAESRTLARASGALVVSVDYRLAPEHPFPAGLTDCHDAVGWVADNRERLGVPGARLAVAGESGGGKLAASVTLLARERGGPPIDFQLLVCPMTSRSADGLPSREQLGGDFYPSPAIDWCWERYLTAPEQALDPLASPLQADSFRDLPPALVVTGEYDPLRDEGERYAQRLREADVPADYHCMPGLMHGLFGWERDVPAAAEGLRLVGETLRARLAS